ncbi:uncharacterized protein BDV14DRAFT_198353 [Aspergillus stella-maris]|uniref:uncharacterized protein n=1 Tax=Aspergillus stella-maris TaxID=1810926 RepID=UPI003CCDBEC4
MNTAFHHKDSKRGTYVFAGTQYANIAVIPESIINKRPFVPDHENEFWIFRGIDFMRVKKAQRNGDSIVFGPAKIEDNWPSLNAYFFRGRVFVHITLEPGKQESGLVSGPSFIRDHCIGLEKAGIKRVDAVISVPGVPSDGYFFSGKQFIRLRVTPGEKVTKVVFGPAPVAKHWPALDFAYGSQ